jgi:hypothetical protein
MLTLPTTTVHVCNSMSAVFAAVTALLTALAIAKAMVPKQVTTATAIA